MADALKFHTGERERDAVKRSLCLRGHKLLKLWSGFNRKLDEAGATALYDGLNEFADSTDAFGLADLSEPALNFAIYLSSFVDGLHPSERQWAQLAALAERFDGALKQAEPEAIPLPPSGVETLVAQRTLYYLRLSDELLSGFSAQLEGKGYAVRQFLDPRELKQALREKRADALIADARYLPHLMALLELAEDTQSRAAPRMPCIVLSDSADLGRQLHAVRAGADAFFAEPFELREIERKLEDLILEEAQPATHVLIVEDDRSQALFADAILRQRGMTTRLAFHANDALLALKERKPDVILTDVNMPDISGVELAQTIRQQAGYLDVPIVFLSGEAEDDARVRTIRRAGDDFLSKPAKPRALLAAVQMRVKRARELAQLARSANQRDSVTGLYALPRFVNELGERIKRAHGPSAAVLYALIDQADALSADLGAAAAHKLDRALAQAFAEQLGARAIGAQLRDFCYVAKLDANDRDALVEHANALRQALAQTPFRIDGAPCKITLSIGLKLLDSSAAPTPEAEVARAQAACMGARASGGNRVVCYAFDDDGVSDADQAAIARAVFADGLKSSQRELKFEPLMQMLGNVRGQYTLELKLKRDSESEQTVDPRVYLPIAESLNRRREIDEIALEMAANALKVDARQDMNLRFFVSVDVRHLLDPAFEKWLVELMRVLAIKPAALCLSFDGGPALDRLELLCTRLKSVKQRGFRLCLDEFGRDRVAVHLVDRLPVDCVRLSNDFAATLGSGPRALEHVGQLIERARSHHKTVIVPGVSDAATLNALWTLNPDYVQGSLIATPRARPDFSFPEAFE
jgi:PleD family two-component response regulator/EAL domain-containing protein (putative c-di-GMP-specific phosphodiesterase class I)